MKWDSFRALLVIQPDRRFENKLKSAIKVHFRMRNPERQNASNYDLITEIIASAVLGGYCYWLEKPEQMKEAEFKRVVTQTLDQFITILR